MRHLFICAIADSGFVWATTSWPEFSGQRRRATVIVFGRAVCQMWTVHSFCYQEIEVELYHGIYAKTLDCAYLTAALCLLCATVCSAHSAVGNQSALSVKLSLSYAISNDRHGYTDNGYIHGYPSRIRIRIENTRIWIRIRIMQSWLVISADMITK
jgi:hypothetical protein